VVGGGCRGVAGVSRASTTLRRAPGSSVARRDRRNVCDRDPLGNICLSTMRTRMSGTGSTLERGTSMDDAREILLKGAPSPEAALNSNVARRREGVEIILVRGQGRRFWGTKKRTSTCGETNSGATCAEEMRGVSTAKDSGCSHAVYIPKRRSQGDQSANS
jgi:hypothetical protein